MADDDDRAVFGTSDTVTLTASTFALESPGNWVRVHAEFMASAFVVEAAERGSVAAVERLAEAARDALREAVAGRKARTLSVTRSDAPRYEPPAEWALSAWPGEDAAP